MHLKKMPVHLIAQALGKINPDSIENSMYQEYGQTFEERLVKTTLWSVMSIASMQDIEHTLGYPDPDILELNHEDGLELMMDIKLGQAKNESKGDWAYEKAGGDHGYRCTKCNTWIDDGSKFKCKCDEGE